MKVTKISEGLLLFASVALICYGCGEKDIAKDASDKKAIAPVQSAAEVLNDPDVTAPASGMPKRTKRNNSPEGLNPPIAAAPIKPQDNREQIDLLNKRIDALDLAVRKLRFDARISELDLLVRKGAEINPLSKEAVALATNFGTLIVSCKGVDPYLNGFKLKLLIGNPLQMTFNGFTLVCVYGQNQTDREKRSKEIFPNSLRPGSWSDVEMTLVPSTLEDLGHIEILFTTDKLHLNGPLKP